MMRVVSPRGTRYVSSKKNPKEFENTVLNIFKISKN